MSDEPTSPALRPLCSGIYDFATLQAEATAMGQRRRVFFSPTATLEQFVLQMSTLDPGQSPHAPHQHPDEEMILIKDGMLEISLNGELRRVGAGSVVFIAPNDLHGWTNVGPDRANYFVLRWWTTKTAGPIPQPG